ncbi:MAG: Mut7-C RNAse domain-containing protein [Balneolaceae bacterium]|nr:Mut7-C RNAse domain-containing protein [Balneolaceae bacterium]
MTEHPNTADIYVLGSLIDFLSGSERSGHRPVRFSLHPAAKDLVEALGVPHVEIFALKVNNQFTTLDYQVQDRDILRVYPMEMVEKLDREILLRDPDEIPGRFIADRHLGKLTRLLRLVGIDTIRDERWDDAEIVKRAVEEKSCWPSTGSGDPGGSPRSALGEVELSDLLAEVLGGLEDRHEPGRHLHRLPGTGIARHARLAFPHLEGAEAADLDVLTVAQGALHRVEERVDDQGAVLLRDPGADGLRDLIDEIRLGHHRLQHSVSTSGRKCPDVGRRHGKPGLRAPSSPYLPRTCVNGARSPGRRTSPGTDDAHGAVVAVVEGLFRWTSPRRLSRTAPP